MTLRRLYWAMLLSGIALIAIALSIHGQIANPTLGTRSALGVGRANGAAAPRPPSRAQLDRMLSGSPPRLASLHRQAAQLLESGGLGRRVASLHGFPAAVVVWASWCPPCRQELPLFATAAARFGRRVAFLGADLEDDAGQARELLARQPLSFPSYPVSAGELGPISPVQGTPDTLYLDRAGNLVGKRIGAYDSLEALEADLRRYSSASPTA